MRAQGKALLVAVAGYVAAHGSIRCVASDASRRQVWRCVVKPGAHGVLYIRPRRKPLAGNFEKARSVAGQDGVPLLSGHVNRPLNHMDAAHIVRTLMPAAGRLIASAFEA